MPEGTSWPVEIARDYLVADGKNLQVMACHGTAIYNVR
jgi:hypothetical protein